MNPWLGAERGFLSDWATQRWVRLTGSRLDSREALWLEGPWARTTGIEDDDFERFAAVAGYERVTDSERVGLLADFGALRSERFAPDAVHPAVVDFYEHTARYRLQLWSEWSALFRPLGRAVDAIFARRLGQLQLPLTPLETSRGLTSALTQFRAADGATATAWVRRQTPSQKVIYAGFYTIARPPLASGPCVKVTFPLPNGHASVFLEPSTRSDGALVLDSVGHRVGHAGFYFVVNGRSGELWVKPVPQLTERIIVFADSDGELHTDHVLRIWGRVFMRLHYVMPLAN